MADLPITRFEVLPEELVASILENVPERQAFRSVSRCLSYVIQEWFGLEVVMKGSNLSRMPSSLLNGQITSLVLQNITSANHHRIPPTPRLRKLEFSGVMRLENLLYLLQESPNLKELFITAPEILGKEFFLGLDILLPPLKLTHIQIKVPSSLESCLTELRILGVLALASLKFLQSFRIVFDGEPFPNNFLIWLEESSIQNLEGSKRSISAGNSLILRDILQGSLKELSLTRQYDEPPFNMPNAILEKLELNWRGDDLWLKDLLEGQGSNKLLKVLSLSCSVEFWAQRIVQEAVGQLKESLTELNLSLNSNTAQLVDFDLSFFLKCSKLRKFSFFTEWHLGPGLGTGFNTFADLGSVILPPRLEEVTLGGPFRPEALALFCAHPNLKYLKLVYYWGFYDEKLALDLENPQNAFHLNWEWLKGLILKSPKLNQVIMDSCMFDIRGIEPNCNSLPGMRIDVKSGSKTGSMSIHINEIPILMDFTSAQINISRITLDSISNN